MSSRGASSFNASTKAAAAAITQTNDDGKKRRGNSDKSKDLLMYATLKHFCALGVFFTGLLYVAYALSHIGYTATRPLHTVFDGENVSNRCPALQAAEWLRFMDYFVLVPACLHTAG